MFIPEGDQIVCKTYMTRVEGEKPKNRYSLNLLSTAKVNLRSALQSGEHRRAWGEAQATKCWHGGQELSADISLSQHPKPLAK
jgi:hypothetical protein